MSSSPTLDPDSLIYIGTELRLFAKAIRWKRYWQSQLKPYVSGRVAEVGAGIGGSTPWLVTEQALDWTLIEPDPKMNRFLHECPPSCLSGLSSSIVKGPLCTLNSDVTYDTITYIDVLEHIEHDEAEIRTAASHLQKDGHLIVLAPAMQSLFSPFDRAVGHFRRYERSDSKRLNVPGLKLVKCAYLDSLGASLNFINRLLLRRAEPTMAQILFWDRCIVPFSRVIDKLIPLPFGRSIIMIWTKTE